MKKLVVLFLALMMMLTLVACGGANNDANNAVIKAKIDTLDNLSKEIEKMYADNSGMTSEDPAIATEALDKMKTSMEAIKTEYDRVVADGGYSADDVTEKGAILDTMIGDLTKSKEALVAALADAAAIAPAEDNSALVAALTEKYNTVADIVNQASAKATETGWDQDAAFASELDASIKLLNVLGEDLGNPDTMDAEYMETLSTSLDTMLVTWESYLVQVSETYTK